MGGEDEPAGAVLAAVLVDDKYVVEGVPLFNQELSQQAGKYRAHPARYMKAIQLFAKVYKYFFPKFIFLKLAHYIQILFSSVLYITLKA